MRIEDNVMDPTTAVERADPRGPLPAGRRIARMTVLLGPDEGRTYKFADECTIGRSPDATITVTDRGVSRIHVRVRRVSADRFVIEDQGSRNGTLVNGDRVATCELQSGARIQVGPRCLLLFSVHDDFEESLAQATKMEIIGRLSAGINHDFNNLLCVLLANASYLLELPRQLTLGNGEVRECLEDMRAAAQAGAELTGRLATLVQGGPVVHENVDLSKLCHELVAVLSDTLPRSVRVEAQIQPGIVVRGVRAHLWQLLLNPCLNARDAMPDGGVLAIRAALQSADELDLRPPVHAEEYAVISVTDTGRGMTPDVLKSAFEPFFTTKDIDLGRGLGLATVRKVAAEHGGTVKLSSRPGAGATLRIVLPMVDLDAAADSGCAFEPAASGRGSQPGRTDPAAAETLRMPALEATRPRVLVVEDDRALARAFGRALRRAGYDVVWAETGRRARELFEEQASMLRAALLDLDMSDPELRQAHALIRARNPELPVLVLTAVPDPVEPPAVAASAEDLLLRKPIDPGVLARAVSTAMRRHGRTSKP